MPVESKQKSALGAMVAAFLTLSILLSGLLSITIIYNTKTQLNHQLETSIKADLEGFMDLYEQRFVVGIREGMERRTQFVASEDFIFLLLNRDGSHLAGNANAWPEGMTADDEFQTINWADTENQHRNYKALGHTLNGGFKIMVARSTLNNELVIKTQVRLALILTGILTLISGSIGVIASRRILRQVDAINDVAGKIKNGFINQRVPVSKNENEFQNLANNINDMLDKISSNNERMNTLSENVAHELRTPLNRIKKALHRLSTVEKRDVFTIEQQVEDISAEVDGTIRIFDAILEIATTNQAVLDKTRFEKIDIVALIKELIVLLEPVGEEHNQTFVVTMLPERFVLGSKQLLMQMISNVIDNALKFSPDNGKIWIEVKDDGALLRLGFENESVVIPENLEEIAFTQFQRGTNAREKTGFGLGLPLVKAIATRHGFDVRVSQDNNIFRIEFNCPHYDDTI